MIVKNKYGFGNLSEILFVIVIKDRRLFLRLFVDFDGEFLYNRVFFYCIIYCIFFVYIINFYRIFNDDFGIVKL